MPFLGVPRKAGEVHKQRVPVGEFSDGSPVLLPVATITGRRDGPTVYIQGGTHGDEVTGIEIARRVISEIKPEEIRGCVVVVPVANVPAYLTRSRGWLLEERLSMDGINRLYPGLGSGLMSERIAHVVCNEFMAHADFSLDLHAALDGCEIVPFTTLQADRGDGTYELRKHIALVFGTPYIYRTDLAIAANVDMSRAPINIRSGTDERRAAPAVGRPFMAAEMGESRRVSWQYVPIGVRGVRRTLQVLEVLPGEPQELNEPQRSFTQITPVQASRGGGLRLAVGLGDEVQAGQRIGEIVDVFGETVEGLVAPVSGFIQRMMKLANVATGAEAVWIAH